MTAFAGTMSAGFWPTLSPCDMGDGCSARFATQTGAARAPVAHYYERQQ